MAQTFGNNLKNALEESRAIFLENEVPKLYVEALYQTQFFEILLENLYASLIAKGSKYFASIGLDYNPEKRDNWTIKGYIKRLKTFFPREKYGTEYVKLEDAQKKRNDFVHGCFRIKNGEVSGISLDRKKVHLDQNAIRKMNDWNSAFVAALPVIIKFATKSNKAQELINSSK